jgi:cytoskeletal protein CcmA (bactofilin family)
MKKTLLLLILLACFGTANAFRIEWGKTVTITQPIHEDLYVAGGTITLDAPVYGDVIVAGGTVNINDTITNDLLVAGGNVTISGYVADDIRCAGGKLHILRSVGGDLAITGGNVNIGRNVVIGGGLIAGGGEIIVDGTITGDVRAAAGTFTFNGIANRNFDCRSGKLVMNGVVMGTSILAAREITLQHNAAFQNNVRYWNNQGKLDFKQSLRNASATYDPALQLKENNWYFLNHSTALGLTWYLATVFLFILILQYLFGKAFRQAGATVDHSPTRSLGAGFLFLVGVPVSVVLLLITIIGLPVGLLLMACYIVVVLLATVITALVIANWYNNRFQYNWGYWKIVSSAMAMFVLFKLVSFTPVFGWLIMIAIACIAFGAILRSIHWRHEQAIAV